jgi:hypothetical protein
MVSRDFDSKSRKLSSIKFGNFLPGLSVDQILVKTCLRYGQIAHFRACFEQDVVGSIPTIPIIKSFNFY